MALFRAPKRAHEAPEAGCGLPVISRQPAKASAALIPSKTRHDMLASAVAGPVPITCGIVDTNLESAPDTVEGRQGCQICNNNDSKIV